MIPLKPNVFLAKYLPHSPVRRFYLYVVGKKRKEARKVLIDFMGEGLSRRESRYHLRKMMEAHVRYAWQFDEYFIYAYNDINSKERREIVPEEEKDFSARTSIRGSTMTCLKTRETHTDILHHTSSVRYVWLRKAGIQKILSVPL